MAEFRLTEDFAGMKKGDIVETINKNYHDFYKGVRISIPIDSPLLEPVPEYKVGDVVWHRVQNEIEEIVIIGGIIVGRSGAQEYIYTGKNGKKYLTFPQYLSPAPPMPPEPVDYAGKQWRVKRQNGVPVLKNESETTTADIVYCTECERMSSGNDANGGPTRNHLVYILEPVVQEVKQYEYINSCGEIKTEGIVTEADIRLYLKRKAVGNVFEPGTLDGARTERYFKYGMNTINSCAKKAVKP